MRQRGYVAVLVCVTLGLAGCFRSPTPRFFTLSPMINETASVEPSPQGARVGLVSLTLPTYLLDPRMSVVAGGNEVVRDEFERWAEDLDENFRRVLLENLSRELVSSNVAAIDGISAQPGTHMLRVEVLRFDADTEGVARLRVRWNLSSEASTGVFVISEWSEAVQDPTTQMRVKALSGLVSVFAREVASRVTRGA
ncbi:MAG: hypothetical protein RL326_613 [Pseudomonadota bacterium]